MGLICVEVRHSEDQSVALMPHAVAVIGHAERLSDPEAATLVSDATSHLLNQMGLYQNSRAQFAAAEPLMRRALLIDEAYYGAEHPHTQTVRKNLEALERERK